MKRVRRSCVLLWICITLQSCTQDLWEYELVYTITGLQGLGSVWVALPVSVKGRQHIESRDYSLQPVRVRSQNGDSAAEFRVLGDGRPLQIKISGRVKIYPPSGVALKSHWRWQAIEKMLSSELEYRKAPDEKSYTQAWLKGWGDCAEWAELAVMACRFAGDSAMRMEGVWGPSETIEGHAWAECYHNNDWGRVDAVLYKLQREKTNGAYLQIPHLGHWPDFAGHRWLAVRSATPIQSDLTGKLQPVGKILNRLF